MPLSNMCRKITLLGEIGQNTDTLRTKYLRVYSGADKSLARPGRKQANVSVRMA